MKKTIRNARIAEEALGLMPFPLIGRRHGVSRERVRSIIRRILTREEIGLILEARMWLTRHSKKRLSRSEMSPRKLEKVRRYHREYAKRRYQANPEKMRAYWRERQHKLMQDPVYREKYYARMKEKQRIRLQTDASYRAAKNKANQTYFKKRYHADPVFREKVLINSRINYQRRKELADVAKA